MRRRRRAVAGWVALAVGGLVVAVAISYTASRLVAQDVGLSGEPRLSREALAPASTATAPTSARPVPPARTTGTATVPSRTPAPTVPQDSGDDHGSGRAGDDSRGGDGSDDGGQTHGGDD